MNLAVHRHFEITALASRVFFCPKSLIIKLMFHILAFETNMKRMAVYLLHEKETNTLKVYSSKKRLFERIKPNYSYQAFGRKIDKNREWIDYDGNLRIFATHMNE